jgi:glutamyl aminopeptidase
LVKCNCNIVKLSGLTECPCAGEKPNDLVEETLSNSTIPAVPLATNGEVFPWNNVRLPNFVRPTRYTITVHPNLTTLEVKGKQFLSFILLQNACYVTVYI